MLKEVTLHMIVSMSNIYSVTIWHIEIDQSNQMLQMKYCWKFFSFSVQPEIVFCAAWDRFLCSLSVFTYFMKQFLQQSQLFQRAASHRGLRATIVITPIFDENWDFGIISNCKKQGFKDLNSIKIIYRYFSILFSIKNFDGVRIMWSLKSLLFTDWFDTKISISSKMEFRY